MHARMRRVARIAAYSRLLLPRAVPAAALLPRWPCSVALLQSPIPTAATTCRCLHSESQITAIAEEEQEEGSASSEPPPPPSGSPLGDATRAAAAEFMAPAFTRHPLEIVRGKGALVWDAAGKQYLDFSGSPGGSAVGHCNGLVLRAAHAQLDQLWHSGHSVHSSAPAARLAQRLSAASDGAMQQVLFTNSANEAIDAAIKLVRAFQAQQAAASGEKPATGVESSGAATAPPASSTTKRTEIISFSSSSHGVTLGGLALSRGDLPFLFKHPLRGFRMLPFNDEAAVDTHIGPTTIAVFVEPVQMEGIVAARPSFLWKLHQACARHGVLLVYDESQCGGTRTGSFYAYRHRFNGRIASQHGAEVKASDNDAEQSSIFPEPDLLILPESLGAGLPFGGIIMKSQVATAIQPGLFGFNMSGGALVCSIAESVLDQLLRPSTSNGVLQRARQFRQSCDQLQRLLVQADSPVRLLHNRGLGLMLAMELNLTDVTPIVDACRREGLLLGITSGKRSLRILPPLDVTSSQLTHSFDILWRVMTSPVTAQQVDVTKDPQLRKLQAMQSKRIKEQAGDEDTSADSTSQAHS